MNNNYPKFSWSFSRANTFEGCKRQYAYNYYVSHKGWLKYGVEQIAKDAYRLKKLQTLPMLFGSIVHDVIAEAIINFLNNDEMPSYDEMVEKTRNELNQIYSYSRKNVALWKNAPSKERMLQEIYYDGIISPEALKTYSEKIDEVYNQFMESETWKDILSEPNRYRFEQVEDFATIQMNNKDVYVVLDLLLYDSKEDKYLIVDWKTGKANNNDRIQLVLYALYVMYKKGVQVEDIVAINEYLGTGKRTVFTPTTTEISIINDIFLKSSSEMEQFLEDVHLNKPLPLEMFKKNERLNSCSRCNFREICKPNVLKNN